MIQRSKVTAESVYTALAHGDDDHRRWLKEALICHFDGKPIPTVKGLGTREMIFPILYEAAQKGELLLVEGGICIWHQREDNKIVIKAIISTQRGAGTEMLKRLKQIAKEKHASGFILKCPIDLEANNWYKEKGFEFVMVEGKFNVWWLPIGQGGV